MSSIVYSDPHLTIRIIADDLACQERLHAVTPNPQRADGSTADDYGIAYCADRYTLGTVRMSTADMREREADPEYVCYPVFAYVHGGIALSMGGEAGVNPFSCPWDSGKCGFAYVRKDWAEAEGIRDAARFLRGTVDELSMILNGEGYAVAVETHTPLGKECAEAIGHGFGGIIGRDYAQADADALAAAVTQWFAENVEREQTVAEVCGMEDGPNAAD